MSIFFAQSVNENSDIRAALLLPAQNTHTLHDPIRGAEHARARGVEDGLGVGGLDCPQWRCFSVCGSRVNGLLHVTLGRQLIQSAGQYSRCVTATSRASRAAYKGVSDADHSRGLEVSQDRHIAQPRTNTPESPFSAPATRTTTLIASRSLRSARRRSRRRVVRRAHRQVTTQFRRRDLGCSSWSV